MIHIHESNGVLLHVEYSPASCEAGPTFHSIRVMDNEYRPIGPDLSPLLHNLVLLDDPNSSGTQEAERFLSTLVGELS